MAVTLNTLAYSQDTFLNPNKVQYIGPAHTTGVVDTLTMLRVDPKPTKDSDGVAKAEVRRTKTVTLANGKKVNAVVYSGVQFPVGMTVADADALRDDVGDFVISANGKDLLWNRKVAQ